MAEIHVSSQRRYLDIIPMDPLSKAGVHLTLDDSPNTLMRVILTKEKATKLLTAFTMLLESAADKGDTRLTYRFDAPYDPELSQHFTRFILFNDFDEQNCVPGADPDIQMEIENGRGHQSYIWLPHSLVKTSMINQLRDMIGG